jgi:hypothetical protein
MNSVCSIFNGVMIHELRSIQQWTIILSFIWLVAGFVLPMRWKWCSWNILEDYPSADTVPQPLIASVRTSQSPAGSRGRWAVPPTATVGPTAHCPLPTALWYPVRWTVHVDAWCISDSFTFSSLFVLSLTPSSPSLIKTFTGKKLRNKFDIDGHIILL